MPPNVREDVQRLPSLTGTVLERHDRDCKKRTGEVTLFGALFLFWFCPGDRSDGSRFGVGREGANPRDKASVPAPGREGYPRKKDAARSGRVFFA